MSHYIVCIFLWKSSKQKITRSLLMSLLWKHNKTNSKKMCVTWSFRPPEIKKGQARKTTKREAPCKAVGCGTMTTIDKTPPSCNHTPLSAFADGLVMILTSLKWPQRSITWSNLHFNWGINMNLPNTKKAHLTNARVWCWHLKLSLFTMLTASDTSEKG